MKEDEPCGGELEEVCVWVCDNVGWGDVDVLIARAAEADGSVN